MGAGRVAVRWIAAGVTAASLAAALIAWQLRGADTAPARPDLNDPRRILAGQGVYATYCAGCHGANLEGQPHWTVRRPDGRLPAPPHDDTGHTWHHPSDMLFAMTRHGMTPPHAPAGYESDMPAFAGVLSDDEIWAVLAFIRSRWSERVRATHESLDRQARAHTAR